MESMKKIFALIVCALFLAGSSNAELVITKKKLELNAGDYVKYEIMGNTFGTAMGKYMFGDDFVDIEAFEAQVEDTITGFETIEVDNQTYDCYILKRTMNFNFTVIIEEGSYDPQPDDDRLHYLFGFEVKLWQDDSNLIPDTIKSESIDSYTQTWAEGGEDKSYEGVTEEQTVHTKTQGAWPDTLEVGSSWTFSEDTSTSSTSRSRMNGGEWDVETSETEESETTDYEVTDEAKVTTSAGTFDTLIVKAVLQGEGQGNYTLEYINSDFISIKRVVIENDESILTMQILEYSISSLESPSSEDGDSIAEGLPNLSFLLSVSSIILIAIVSRVRMD